MADVDISTVYEGVSLAEIVALAQELGPTVVDMVGVSDSAGVAKVLTAAVNDAVTVAEKVAQKKGIAVITGKNVIALQSIGEVNWNWMDNFPGNRAGVRIHAISVMAAGADTFILRDGSATGPIWFQNISAGAENKVVQIGGMLLRPVMVASEQTLSAASRYAIIYEKP